MYFWVLNWQFTNLPFSHLALKFPKNTNLTSIVWGVIGLVFHLLVKDFKTLAPFHSLSKTPLPFLHMLHDTPLIATNFFFFFFFCIRAKFKLTYVGGCQTKWCGER